VQNKRSGVLGASCLAIALVLCAPASTLGQSSPKTDQGSPSERHHLVLLLDTNPDQKKVFDVELTIAEGVMEKLNEPENPVSDSLRIGAQWNRCC
jgi:hypothetical protein